MLDPSLCPCCFAPAVRWPPCPGCGHDPAVVTAKTNALLLGTTLAERYVVGGLLGQGGFGATYRGYDTRLASLVAIKEYFPYGAATRSADGSSITVSTHIKDNFQFGRSKFLEEARTLAKLRSIHRVVSVYDFFEGNNTAYIIMEFLSGRTLKQLQDTHLNKRVPSQTALPIFKNVLSALLQIHDQQFLHRDISPDNIIMVDDVDEIKLLDFGAARQALSNQDQRLTVILKPGYAPFEQYSDYSNHGPWSDIYAAGATFYTLLSGTKPIDSLKRLMNDKLKPLSALGVSVPARVDRAIMKALAVQPRDRWQNAADFAEELLAGTPATSHPSPPPVQRTAAAAPEREPAKTKVATIAAPAILRPTIESNYQGASYAVQTTATVARDGRVGVPVSVIELRKLLEEHAKFLAGKPNGRRLNLSMRSLVGVKLVAANLSGAELTGAIFVRADLSGTNFTNANLFCADFTEANLVWAKFIRSDLRGACFDGAELTGALFEGADCREGVMLFQGRDGQLQDVKTEHAKRAASFQNARMTCANFRSANLIAAKFGMAALDNADFCGADLTGACMTGTVLKSAKFQNATLQDCDFTKANMEGVDTSAPEFKGAKIVRHLHEIDQSLQHDILEHQRWVESLSHSGKRLVLKNANLVGLQMTEVDWSAAELLSVNMTDINLHQAKISMTDFSGSTLHGANLSDVDARGSKFNGCFMQACDFSNAKLAPVISSQGKHWCTNFRATDLKGSNFRAADCPSVDFRDADLRLVCFRNTILKNANFTGASLEGADFTGAITDGAVGIR
ncbi:MAG: serine/threonine-protein kinase [Rhodospirillaceae bacterium]